MRSTSRPRGRSGPSPSSGPSRRFLPTVLGLAPVLVTALAACGTEVTEPEVVPNTTADETVADAAEESTEAPRPSGLVVSEPGTHRGYTLITPLNSMDAHLVDMSGEIVHTWTTEYAPAGGIYLLDDGHLLRCGRVEDIPGFHGGGIGGVVQKFDWDGNVVWEYRIASDRLRQHHDIEPLPNGNVLVIAWELIPPGVAVAHGRDPDQVGDEGFWPDIVQEIRPVGATGGEVVWEWRAWDHIVQDRDPDLPNYGAIHDHPGFIDINFDHRYREAVESDEERQRRVELEEQMAALGYVGGTPADAPPDAPPPGPEGRGGPPPGDPGRDGPPPGGPGGDAPRERPRQRPDWMHTNAVAYLPEHDLVALSSPSMNEVFVVDHSTTTEEAATDRGGRFDRGGRILWRWGNPRNYGAGGAEDRALWYQHDPTWLVADDGALSLLVFNNGRGRADDAGWSSVDELPLPFDPQRGFTRQAGRRFGPPVPSWTYEDRDGFLSEFISGAQRLPNGNTLICSGKNGRVFEVTQQGEILWDWWSPLGGEIEPSEQGGNAPPNALFRATRLAPDHPGLAGRF
jgi:hypothetical protein